MRTSISGLFNGESYIKDAAKVLAVMNKMREELGATC